MYKVYTSTVDIFWNNETQSNFPSWNIDDSYFNYQYLSQYGINFKTWDTAQIVVKDRNVSHVRLVHEKRAIITKTYWIVTNIDKVLKEGYVLNLKIDVYMTYIKGILKSLSQRDVKVYLERLSLTTRLLKNENYNGLFSRICRLDDDLIDGIKPIFKAIDVKKSSKYDNNRLLAFHADSQYDVVKSPNNPSIKSDVTYDLGLYAIFSPKNNKDHGYKVASYHAFPIYTELNSAYTMRMQVGGKTINFANNMRDISTYLINRETNTYGLSGYVGTYIMPHPFPQVDYHTAQVSKTVGDNDNKVYFLFYKVDAIRSSDFVCEYQYPSSGLNDDIFNFFACMHNEVQVGITRKKYKDIYGIKPQSSGQQFTIKYQLMFNDGFIGVPNEASGININEADMISFGNQLPSETQDYLKAIRAAKQNYDMGLSSLAVSGVKQFVGAGAAGLQGAAAGALAGGPVGAVVGAAGAAGMSMFNLVTDQVSGLIKLNRDYNYATAGAQRTYINSYTKDIFNYIFYKTMFFNSSASDYSSKFKAGIALLHYELSDEYKDLYKNMYKLYGFPIKGFISFKEMVEQNQYDKICYIKFNLGWVLSMFRDYINSAGINYAISQEEFNVIANFLGNGLRIRLDNNPWEN